MAAALDLTGYLGGNKEERIELMFQFFDVDQDGWLGPDEFKAMLKATNPKQAGDVSDAMVKGTLMQLSKQAVFRGNADAAKGLTLDGLILSYTKLPGNDVDQDAVTLGWVTAAEVAAAPAAE